MRLDTRRGIYVDSPIYGNQVDHDRYNKVASQLQRNDSDCIQIIQPFLEDADVL